MPVRDLQLEVMHVNFEEVLTIIGWKNGNKKIQKMFRWDYSENLELLQVNLMTFYFKQLGLYVTNQPIVLKN